MSPSDLARRVPLLCVAGTLACAHIARPERVYLERVVSPDPLASQLHRTMEEFTVDGFTGTVLVARGPRVLLYQGYGDANRARHLPNTAETKYPFGALAKQFAATDILQLETEGLLRTAASGRSLRDVKRERLFQPGRLSRTVYDDGFLDDSLVARGYTGPYGSTIVVTGLVGPLADLFQWHQALHSGALLPRPAQERMFTPTENGYGLGWVVGQTANGARIIEHASDQPGFQMWYGYLPTENVLVLLAVNNDLGFRRPVAERLTEILTSSAWEAERGVTKAERIGGK